MSQAIRDAAITALAGDGLSHSQIADLHMSDYDGAAVSYWDNEGSCPQRDQTTLAPATVAALDAWIAVRTTFFLPEALVPRRGTSPRIFCNLAGERTPGGNMHGHTAVRVIT